MTGRLLAVIVFYTLDVHKNRSVYMFLSFDGYLFICLVVCLLFIYIKKTKIFNIYLFILLAYSMNI